MSDGKVITTFRELETGESEPVHYFFLENLLKARIELNRETGDKAFEEEMNIYLADLLSRLVSCTSTLADKPYLSPFDVDVRSYVTTHPGLRNEYRVYKDNADFGLLSITVFCGHHHEGSYHERVLGKQDETPRIATYYAIASSALAHLRGIHETLVHVLTALSQHISDISAIIRKVAGDYFDYIQRISEGSLFHLQKRICDSIQKKHYLHLIDEFLDSLSHYRKNNSPHHRERVLRLTEEIRSLNPNFSFQTESL